MVRARCVCVVFAVGLVLVLQGCAETSTQRMINANDHAGLANYYAEQAQELREKAKRWEMTAEYYDKHSEPHGKTEPKQHAAHCRAIAQNNLKAADEAEALAQEHRAMRPPGMMHKRFRNAASYGRARRGDCAVADKMTGTRAVDRAFGLCPDEAGGCAGGGSGSGRLRLAGAPRGTQVNALCMRYSITSDKDQMEIERSFGSWLNVSTTRRSSERYFRNWWRIEHFRI